MHICGDYKLTVNLVSRLERYPIRKLEDLFEKLSGGEKFSKLDLSHAYQQVTLDEASKPCVTIKRHKGLFQVNRLLFRVSFSPAIFSVNDGESSGGNPKVSRVPQRHLTDRPERSRTSATPERGPLVHRNRKQAYA